jgi:branched-chain amino acid aminotransferase
MDLPYTIEELRAATHEVVAVNGNASCYIRPLAFYGFGELGVSSIGNPVDVVIISFPWGAYLGEDSQTKGITAKISSWERVGPNVIPHVAKATGIYLNSMLATMEARRGGYDEAIMLSHDGYIADGPGENIFVVKDGVLSTPPLSMSILPGITRETVIQIARDLDYRVEETSTWPTRCSWSERPPRSLRCVPSTTRRSASGLSRANCRRHTSLRSTARTSAGSTISTWSS